MQLVREAAATNTAAGRYTVDQSSATPAVVPSLRARVYDGKPEGATALLERATSRSASNGPRNSFVFNAHFYIFVQFTSFEVVTL